MFYLADRKQGLHLLPPLRLEAKNRKEAKESASEKTWIPLSYIRIRVDWRRLLFHIWEEGTKIFKNWT